MLKKWIDEVNQKPVENRKNNPLINRIFLKDHFANDTDFLINFY